MDVCAFSTCRHIHHIYCTNYIFVHIMFALFQKNMVTVMARTYQRGSPEQKETWYNFCGEEPRRESTQGISLADAYKTQN